MSETGNALVTGAGGILGRAAAQCLLEEGMQVVLADLQQEQLNTLSQELSGETFPIAFDISDPGQIDTTLSYFAMRRKKWGRIINVSSLAAKTGGITADTAYSTSKGALISLTFSLAAETAADGITVDGIAPAYVKTPMVTEQLIEAQHQELLKKIPVRRFCEPKEFAHVVRFLVHPLAGFITGEIIDQNGGLLFD